MNSGTRLHRYETFHKFYTSFSLLLRVLLVFLTKSNMLIRVIRNASSHFHVAQLLPGQKAFLMFPIQMLTIAITIHAHSPFHGFGKGIQAFTNTPIDA